MTVAYPKGYHYKLRRPVEALYQPVAVEHERKISILPGVEVVMSIASAYPIPYRNSEYVNVAIDNLPFYYVKPIDLLKGVAAP